MKKTFNRTKSWKRSVVRQQIPQTLHSVFRKKIKSKQILNSKMIQQLTDHKLTIIDYFHF